MATADTRNFDAYLDRNASTIGEVIHDLWIAKDRTLWARQPYFYTRLGSIADQLGQVMFAHDILGEGLRYFPDNLRIAQLYSLSAIKCGFLVEARDLLNRLVKSGHNDEETLGILGRLYKELWLLEGGEQTDHPSLRTSRNLYLKAFLKSHGYYSGINAATLSALVGDWNNAGKLARRVMKICEEKAAQGGESGPWLQATTGEASALLGDEELSLRSYRRAREEAHGNLAEIASMRRQLKLLRRVTPLAEEILAELRVPPVVAFVGHMLDRPGRRSPRLPPAAAPAAREAIAEMLSESGALIGYSSAACGSDLLFLECMQSIRSETNVILPFAREDFFATSVAYAGEEWVSRARAAIDHSSSVEESGRGSYFHDDLLFRHANQVIIGKAILRSRLLDTEPLLLSVWDGRRKGEPGGTFETVEAWRRLGFVHRNVDPKALRRARVDIRSPEETFPKAALAAEPVDSRANPDRYPPGIRREVVTFLFADLVGYSRLAEDQVPYFVQGFLGSLVERMKKLRGRPLFKNVWGDALCFAFSDPIAAADCALSVRDLVRRTEWSSLHLPADLAIRIGLHAGPVFRGREPILNQLNFFGSHVNLAARIEPITRPGNVYASEQFVALLVARGSKGIDSRYVGVITLPKEFGSYPIYHIKRANEIE